MESTPMTIDFVHTNSRPDRPKTAGTRAQILADKREEAASRREHVQEERQRKEASRLKTLESRIAAKDLKARAQSGADQMSKNHEMQERWYFAAALASKMQIVKEFLEERHEQRILTHSAIVLQRKWREYQRRARYLIESRSFMSIRGLFTRFLARRQERLQHEASDIVRQFFQDLVCVMYSFIVLAWDKQTHEDR